MSMKYCPSCKRNVNTEHGYNGVVLVLLLIFFFIPGIIYWAIKRKRRCPICHTPDSMLQAPKFEESATPDTSFPGGS